MKTRSHTFEVDVPKLTKWLYTSSGMFRDACYQFVSMFLLTFVQFCALGGVSFEEQIYLTYADEENGTKPIFGGNKISTKRVKARVCPKCGKVELYVDLKNEE